MYVERGRERERDMYMYVLPVPLFLLPPPPPPPSPPPPLFLPPPVSHCISPYCPLLSLTRCADDMVCRHACMRIHLTADGS